MLFRAHTSEKVKKNLVNFGNFREFPFQWTQNCLYFVQKLLRNLNSKIPTPCKKKKKLKFEQLHTNYSFAFRTAWILKIHLKPSQAYFIKWTISGEPPVGLKSLQDSKWSHSEVILYIAHWLPPCILNGKLVTQLPFILLPSLNTFHLLIQTMDKK